jgi:hypothetical protein
MNDTALRYFHNAREEVLGRFPFEIFPGFAVDTNLVPRANIQARRGKEPLAPDRRGTYGRWTRVLVL